MKLAIHGQRVEIEMTTEEYSKWSGSREEIVAQSPLLRQYPNLSFLGHIIVRGWRDGVEFYSVTGDLGQRGDEAQIAEHLARVLVHRALHEGAPWVNCLFDYEAGVQRMARDILAVRSGRETRESLFDGAPAEDIDALEHWGEYVDAVCAAAE